MPFQTCLSECHQWFSMPWGWENPTLSSGNYHPEKERRTPPWGWIRWQHTVPCRLLCTSSSIKILLIILHCSDKWNAVYCWLQLLIVSPCSTELGLSNIDSANCMNDASVLGIVTNLGLGSAPHSRRVKWRERQVTLDISNSHPEPECWINHLSLCAWHTIISHTTSKSLYICSYIMIVQFFFTLICLFSCSFCIAALSIWNSLPPFVHHVHNIHFKGGLVFLCYLYFLVEDACLFFLLYLVSFSLVV